MIYWIFILVIAVFSKDIDNSYQMPPEFGKHKGTYLQWPHKYRFGIEYQKKLDDIWIEMTRALVKSETVYLIVYNEKEKSRVTKLLRNSNIPLDSIRFSVHCTDDVWVRDNGPVFVRDNNGELLIEDWGFNAWGGKKDEYTKKPLSYACCNVIPRKIAKDESIKCILLDTVMVLEGGAFDIDGRKSFIACKSSILSNNRNSGLSQARAEQILKKYLGVNNFIWLDGNYNIDITDQHIDGFAKFANESTIVTMSEDDLIMYGVKKSDIEKLYSARDYYGNKYNYIFLPLTKENVKTSDGRNLGYRGSYVNYYIANKVVLVPNYNDPNDKIANKILKSLYPNKEIIGIDVRDLYEFGGMIHCVTVQRPL